MREGVGALLFGMALGVIAAAAKVPVNVVSGGDVGLLPLVLGVGVATWYGNRVAGVAATGVSALVDTWLLVLQDARAELPELSHWASLLLYLVVGLIAVVVVDSLREAQRRQAIHAEARDRLNVALAQREAELAMLLEQERQAKRQRDAFIDIVSHELRTPITLIVASARLLRRQASRLGEEEAGLVREIEAGSDRLERLVEDLVVLVRSEHDAIPEAQEPVRLQPIVSRVVAMAAERSPEVQFDLAAEPGLPLVRGSDAYVEQVLGNLLSNAAKYNRSGGRVRVLVGMTDDGVSVRVQDEGPGIVEAEAEQLFDLYYRSATTARSVKGSGIGLYVSRRLVEAMGGEIRARRRPEGGSEFELRLRAYDGGDDEPEATDEAGRSTADAISSAG